MTVHGDFLSEIIRQDALSNLASTPVYLSAVEVSGGDDFSRQFFGKLLSPLVERSDYTLDQLLDRIGRASHNLERTSVFSQVKPSVHVDYLHELPEKTTRNYNAEKAINTKVIYELVPAAVNGADVALGFNSEDSLVVDAGYLNTNSNHNAETVRFGVNYRPYKPSEHLDLSMHFVLNLKDPKFRFVADLYSTQNNNQVWQHSSSKATGGVLGVAFRNASNTISVFNGFALAKRTVYDINRANFSAAQPFDGDFLKSSFVTKLAYTTIANLKQPHNGVSAALENEVFSDQKQEDLSLSLFVKTSLSLNLYKTLFGLSAHVFKEAGSIYQSASNKQAIHLADRYYLGGASFRGFARNSLNPEGGAQYYKAGFTVLGKLPYFLHPVKAVNDPLRLYATSFVGDVGDNVFAKPGNMAASAGFGLKYLTDWVTLDAGYYASQRFHSEERAGIRDGFFLELSLGGTNR